MRNMLHTWVLMLIVTLVIGLVSCDIYEDENKDWENRVTIRVTNLTTCPVDFLLDGLEKDQLDPDETYTQENIGQGVHFLEAYPWNNPNDACANVLTPDLRNHDSFDWDILSTSNCGVCDPTPTPAPSATPTPAPTATP